MISFIFDEKVNLTAVFVLQCCIQQKENPTGFILTVHQCDQTGFVDLSDVAGSAFSLVYFEWFIKSKFKADVNQYCFHSH